MEDLLSYFTKKLLWRRLNYHTNRLISPLKNRTRMADRSIKDQAQDNYVSARSVLLGLLGTSSMSYEDDTLMTCFKVLPQPVDRTTIRHAREFVGQLGFSVVFVAEGSGMRVLLHPGSMLASYLNSKAEKSSYTEAVDLLKALR